MIQPQNLGISLVIQPRNLGISLVIQPRKLGSSGISLLIRIRQLLIQHVYKLALVPRYIQTDEYLLSCQPLSIDPTVYCIYLLARYDHPILCALRHIASYLS